MVIGVIGLGYVGLVTSACLSDWGQDVVGHDVDPDRLTALQDGRLPFFEPGLDELVRTGIQRERLRFSDTVLPVADSDIVILAVGTHDGEGGWQTRTIESCLAGLLPQLRDDAVLVIRSTLPPDFVTRLGGIVRELRLASGRPPIPVLLNPEFTREGRAVRDFQEPERVVIGVIDDPELIGVERLGTMYAAADAPILVMAGIDAALTKLAANLFLATKISFANELARLCDAFGARVDRVVEGMSYDPRIGGAFLRAGVGFGGSCLPNQVTMTVRMADAVGVQTPLLDAVNTINAEQRDRFVARIEELLGEGVAGRRVAMLGLTFKPDTDDLRDAPSLGIAQALIARGADVVAFDPMPRARATAAALVPGLTVAEASETALRGADAVALVTEWPEFIGLDWANVRYLVRRPIVVDGRNALDPMALIDAGFAYSAFGRGTARPEAGQDMNQVVAESHVSVSGGGTVGDRASVETAGATRD